MSILIYTLTTPFIPPTVCICALGFLGWLATRRFLRAVERRLNTTAGEAS